MKLFLPIFILAIAAASAWSLVQSKSKPKAIEVDEKAWNVQTLTATPRTMRPTLRLYGYVESPRVSQVASAVNADVLEVKVREGQAVAEGALLAILDGADARLVVDQRAAELAQIEADMQTEEDRHASNLTALPHEKALLSLKRKAAQRARDLARKKVGAQNTLDEALQGVEAQRLQLEQRELSIRQHEANMAKLQASYRRASSLLDRAKLDLQRTAVKAPFQAVVSRVSVAQGERVSLGMSLVELYDTSELEVRAQVPTSVLPNIRKAMAGAAHMTAHAEVDGQALTLRLRGLSGRVNDVNGSVEALFHIVGGSADLPLGRFVSLSLDMPMLTDVVALPPEAIYGRDRVYLLEDERMRAKQIERLGESRGEDGRSLVLARSDALSNGAEVIVTQLPNAIDGLRVHAVEH